MYDSKSLQIHGFPPNLPSNFEGMRMFYDAVWRAFPDSQLVIDDDVIVEGDKAAFRYIFTGTQKEEFMGIPPTGKRVKIDGMTILRFDQSSSKCIERWNLADMIGLMQQIGAISAPPSAGSGTARS